MGVILTDNVPDNTCGFHVRAIEGVVLLIHRVKHTPMDWLQSVSHIRQRSTNNDAHRVVHIGLTHFIFYVDTSNIVLIKIAHIIHSAGGWLRRCWLSALLLLLC